MILMEGVNTKPYAIVLANGRIELDKTNPRARDLLAEKYPNLAVTYDNQEEADATLDKVVDLFKKKGALVGEEADVFTELERLQAKRRDRKEKP